MPGSFSHRTCPRCGTPVGWQRFLLKGAIFARWPCPTCGTRLKFSWKRRLWMGGGIVGLFLYALHAPTSFLTTFTTGVMVAGAALVIGGMIGFLFGIPRTLQHDQPTTKPNSD